MSGLVGNPEDQFSHHEDQFSHHAALIGFKSHYYFPHAMLSRRHCHEVLSYVRLYFMGQIKTKQNETDLFFLFFQFYVPFKIISAYIRQANQSGDSQEKPPGAPASRTWLVSHVPHVGLELTPDTWIRY